MMLGSLILWAEKLGHYQYPTGKIKAYSFVSCHLILLSSILLKLFGESSKAFCYLDVFTPLSMTSN
jgi:hypothetical protein